MYRQVARADFNLLLSGHTHGGQICLPGGIPITLNSVLPRSMGSGPWKYHDMIGYTSVGAGSSVVPVRFNCPPEITLHHFPPIELTIASQWGSSRRFNLKRSGDRIKAPATKIITPATMFKMLNGSSNRLARREKRNSGM